MIISSSLDSINFSPTNQFIAYIDDADVEILDVVTGNLLKTLNTSNTIHNIILSHNNLIALHYWDVFTGELVNTLKCASDNIALNIL